MNDEIISDKKLPIIPQDKLPKVSIITPTYNRERQMRSAIVNYKLFDYPRDKLEWIIVDDGDYDIAKMFPKTDDSIKYYHISPYCKAQLHKMLKSNLKKQSDNLTNKKKKKFKLRNIHSNHFYKLRLPIGMKRNICIQYASGDVIFHMDDDDLYYPKAILHAVTQLMTGWNDGIRCVGSITTGVFHTSKFISMMYSRSDKQLRSQQVMEHTLCYDLSFWKERKFDNQDVKNEGNFFLKNRLDKVKLISTKDFSVVLQHNTNENPIKHFNTDLKDKDPNGWHFKQIPDEQFMLITTFDENDPIQLA